jgi:hypothetical protein
MVTQQLLDYVKSQTEKGKSRNEIEGSLRAAGWQQQDIDQAFANPSAPMPTPVDGKLPRSRQILKEAAEIYKKRYQTLITIALIPTVIYLVLFLIVGNGQNPGIIDHAALNNLGGAGEVLGIIIAVFIIYFYIWGGVSALFAIKDPELNWKDSYLKSQHKIGAYFLTALLAGLAVMGGFILLIVPGIIFGLWFSQFPYVVVEEDLQSTAALKRSKYYVKGRSGEIFGKLFYIGIISIVIYIVIAIILTIVIWTPLITIYGYQVYKYCKSTRP